VFPLSFGKEFVMKKALLVSLFALASLSVLMTMNTQMSANSRLQQKSEIIEKIKSSNAVQISADNSQGSALYIQGAAVREILGNEFTILTDETSSQFAHTTFPEVTLLNNSVRTIKAFVIAVQTAGRPKTLQGLLKENLSIAPNATYKVDSNEWISERVTIQKGDKFVSILRKPELDSPKAWLPGAASGLRVTIGLIEFDDGTTWTISKDSGW
jgi:hypothetical protein